MKAKGVTAYQPLGGTRARAVEISILIRFTTSVQVVGNIAQTRLFIIAFLWSLELRKDEMPEIVAWG